MKNLDKLIKEREQVREKERELTRAIKDARATLAKERKAKKAEASANRDQNYKKLMIENRKLRGMIALIGRATNNLTYSELGERMNCSPDRAREVVIRQINELMRIKW